MADDEVQRVASAGPCATFSIQPPESFDFTKPQEWAKWIRRFERFRLANIYRDESPLPLGRATRQLLGPGGN
ncbi:hypothetical protein CRENBAI_008970 [Crenichthys baileyi]|uniref:Uncharacterized protein n=1 Tax=Crenichthys baileyi TaxID=28760 RepID=A0AAV9RAT4_9TELE